MSLFDLFQYFEIDFGESEPTSGTIAWGPHWHEPVGYYVVNDHLFMYMNKRPNFIHRFFSKLLLGWEWHDNE